MNGSASRVHLKRPLPALELAVMKVLWARAGEATVRDVQEALEPERSLAYTTVMTLLERLVRKGAATRRKQGRGYLYQPVLARDTALDFAVNRLVRDFFRNSRQQLIAYLQENPEPAVEAETKEPDMDSVLL
jgi:predicted transcriptional regulator